MRRVEDDRLMTGAGRFTDDIHPEDSAYAVMVRSPYAHARLLGIDSTAAKASSGCLGVWGGADSKVLGLGLMTCPAAEILKNRDGTDMFSTPRPVLAQGHVRHVGDTVAVVVGETRNAAKDAAALLEIDYEELAAVTSAVSALEQDAPLVWEEAGSNLALDWEMGDEAATAKAFQAAHQVSRVQLVNNRVVANAMEPRSAVGSYDAAQRQFTLRTGTQGVHDMSTYIGKHPFPLPEGHTLRVITEDVGGGFGMKAFAYPEYALVLALARVLGRSVVWTGERSESFTTDTQGRDHLTDAAIALDKEGKFLGVRVETVANLGAYESQYAPFIPTFAGGGMHVGVYEIPTLYNRVRAALTHTTPIDAYRGAGRPEACYVIERLVDVAALDSGISPVELRRRNFVSPTRFGKTAPPVLPFDSGAFETNMDKVLQAADADTFETRRQEKRKQGLWAGLGLSSYVERTAGGITETGRIVADPDGALHIFAGGQSTGQGHETVWSQMVAEKFGVPLEQVRFHAGDTNSLTQGGGTGGSKSLYMALGSLDAAAEALITKGKSLAALALNVGSEEVTFHPGAGAEAEPGFRSAGRQVSLAAMAQRAWQQDNKKTFSEDVLSAHSTTGLLEGIGQYGSAGSTYPNGCHVCEVEIDEETGALRVVRYTVVDDFGTLLNPMIVEGQVHGGIAQGLGQALGEEMVYDQDGQPLTGSFMDYFMPRADDFPSFTVSFYEDAPTTANPWGVKGCGEAGTVAACPAVVNAVVDALKELGVRHLDMPLTPQKLWKTLSKRANLENAKN